MIFYAIATKLVKHGFKLDNFVDLRNGHRRILRGSGTRVSMLEHALVQPTYADLRVGF